MTEAEWLASADPEPMLKFLVGKASNRKLRLFACACCRRVWDVLPDSRSRSAVEINERFADGLVKELYLSESGQQAWQAWEKHQHLSHEISGACWGVQAALRQRPASRSLEWVAACARAVGGWDWKVNPQERLTQAGLLRDVFGRLSFRPADTFRRLMGRDGGTIVKVAQGAYDHRALPTGELDPSRLAVLSDALEEAACVDADLLSHLRSAGPAGARLLGVRFRPGQAVARPMPRATKAHPRLQVA